MAFSVSQPRYLEFGALTFILCFFSFWVVNSAEALSPFVLLGLAFSVCFVFLISKISGGFFLFYILLSITFLENNVGIEPIEMPFYLCSLLLLGFVAFEALKGSLVLETFLDKLFLTFLFLLGFATVYGVLNGANPYRAFGEVTRYLGLFLYFPIRKHLSTKQFRRLLFTALLLLVAYVVIRNLINYRLLISQAVMSWQAENARVASNEFVLLFGASFFMSFAAITTSRIKQIASTALFLVLIGTLILTQSRGYWLAFLLSAISIFFVVNKKGRLRIVLTFLVISSGSIIIATLFFGNLLDIALNGLAARFQTLGSGKLDISLLERLLESKTVLELILNSPVTGYGLGVEFSKKILFFNHFISTSYVHNGYLAAWYKFGVLGFTTIMLIWGIIIKNSYQLYKYSTHGLTRIIALTICGTMIGVLLVNNTSPQTLTFESILFITIFGSYLSTKNIPKNESPG